MRRVPRCVSHGVRRSAFGVRGRFCVLGAVVACILTIAAVASVRHRNEKTQAKQGSLLAIENDLVWKPPALDDTLQRPKLQFKVKNVGGVPVQVLSTTSSCGCATPSVTPPLISPGEIALVDVSAVPPPVGFREIAIILNTDASPAESLTLHAIVHSRRRPPYVIKAGGDLQFVGRPLAEEKRYITVYVAAGENPDREPTLETDLDFLALKLESHKRTQYPFGLDGVYEHAYRYLLTFTRDINREFAVGTVSVIDPWSRANRFDLQFSARDLAVVRILPKRLLLKIDRNGQLGAGQFLILSKKAFPDLSVAPVGSDSPLLVNVQAEADDEEMACRLRVTVSGSAQKPAGAGDYEIEIRCSELPGGRTVVPVRVIAQKSAL